MQEASWVVASPSVDHEGLGGAWGGRKWGFLLRAWGGGGGSTGRGLRVTEGGGVTQLHVARCTVTRRLVACLGGISQLAH